jgi:septum site-determining protein MinC
MEGVMFTEESAVIDLKGGIMICLNSQDSFMALKEQLLTKVEAFHDFVGVNVILDVGERKLSKKESQELRSVLLDKGLHLKKLISRGKSVEYEDESPQAQDSGRAAMMSAYAESYSPEETLLIKRTLRSGQKIIYQGNVVVLGDVNPGAEVIAGGNILVMGSMRGLAHAGAMGGENAVVVALRLNPTQLRIANHITRAPEGESESGSEPEMALIRNGKVVIDKLKV